jgi:hypothetical protein
MKRGKTTREKHTGSGRGGSVLSPLLRRSIVLRLDRRRLSLFGKLLFSLPLPVRIYAHRADIK